MESGVAHPRTHMCGGSGTGEQVRKHLTGSQATTAFPHPHLMSGHPVSQIYAFPSFPIHTSTLWVCHCPAQKLPLPTPDSWHPYAQVLFGK